MWIIFGFLAVALPLIPLVFYSRRPLRNAYVWSVGSFLCYVLLCVDQLMTISRRCAGGDFGGIEDTIGAVLVIVGGVGVAALVLSFVCLGMYYAGGKE